MVEFEVSGDQIEAVYNPVYAQVPYSFPDLTHFA